MTEQTPEAIRERYDLLCRATGAGRAESPPLIERDLDGLQQLLRNELLALARRGSPDNFADLYFALEQELERFREFCAFPALGQKVVIGFGGAFSAGKSSLINTLLGKRLLATEVDPTTTLPTYLLHGEQDAVFALNRLKQCISLSHEEFLSLTHDERRIYGSNVAELLQAAYCTVSSMPWRHLALIDTPGYSNAPEARGGRTDAHIARTQLNAAQAIVWVVSAEGGTISEEDISFLSSLTSNIPLLVVVSRADKRTPDDIARIVALIRQTLVERNLPVLDIIPVSARQRELYPLTPLLTQLQNWDQSSREVGFARNFKKPFMHYQGYLEERQRRAHLHLNRLNRILALADITEVQDDAQELRATIQADCQRLEAIASELLGIRQRFFVLLKQLGDLVGIDMPEPDDVDMIDLRGVDLLPMLRALREQPGDTAPDYDYVLRALNDTAEPANLAHLLRRTSSRHQSAMNLLAANGENVDTGRLLRRRSNIGHLDNLLP